MKTGSGGTWRVAAVGLLVVLATFAVYSPSIGYDFIRLDDDKYIFENPMVSGGFTWAGLKSAWTESTESYWAPLLWMSFMADVELFGLEPWGFHLVNVALFSLNAGLLFALARRWTGRTGMGLAVAMLWAMHPARVESVAWVVERKDVLSGLFILLGIGAYCEGKRGNLRHGTILAWLFMALGGTVKQIVVVMPAMLVLLDVWPLGRTTWSRIWRDGWRLAAEKWAFWALALGLAMLPIWFHHQDGRLLPIPMTHRLAMIPIHYLFYLEKLVWPSGLAVLQGDLAFGWGAFACGVGILAGATWGLWLAREKAPWALAGWAWFVGTLFPLSGVVWGGAERLATRFLYVPQIGLTLAAALAAGETMRLRNWGRGWGMAVCALTVAAWAGLTLRLLPHWRNSQTIFARVLSVNPNSVHAFDNFGRACFFEGKLLEWDRFLDGYRKKHPANPLAEIHAAWWQAAMAGQAEESV